MLDTVLNTPDLFNLLHPLTIDRLQLFLSLNVSEEGMRGALDVKSYQVLHSTPISDEG